MSIILGYISEQLVVEDKLFEKTMQTEQQQAEQALSEFRKTGSTVKLQQLDYHQNMKTFATAFGYFKRVLATDFIGCSQLAYITCLFEWDVYRQCDVYTPLREVDAEILNGYIQSFNDHQMRVREARRNGRTGDFHWVPAKAFKINYVSNGKTMTSDVTIHQIISLMWTEKLARDRTLYAIELKKQNKPAPDMSSWMKIPMDCEYWTFNLPS